MRTLFTDLSDMQVRVCATFADRNLFGTKAEGKWHWITYRAFATQVDEVRGGLAALGVSAGDCVAIIAGNRVEWAVCCYAAYGLGAVFTPMYEHQHVDDWRYIVDDCDAKVLVTSTQKINEMTAGWVTKLGALDHVVGMSLPADDPRSFHALRRAGREAPAARSQLTGADTAGLIYTSGTTGKPKGVILSHGNIASNLNAIHTYMPKREQDVSVSFLPWAHSFGQTCELHMMLSLGASVAFAESIPKLAANLAEVKPTVLYAVPRVFNKIRAGVLQRVNEAGGAKQRIFEAALANAVLRQQMDEAGKVSLAVDLKHVLYDRVVFAKVRERFGGRLRYAFSGGAALSAEVAEFIDALGITVLEGYGLTETSPIAAANRPGARKIGSVGLPVPGVEITLDVAAVDPESAAAGQGEVLVRGPNIMQGYRKLPEQTAAVMKAADDGGRPWFRTGDKGRIDADGFLFITGRIKEQYKLQNGKYVVPAPLEDKLQLSPLIGQAFVYGDNRPFNVALIVADPDLPATNRPTEQQLQAEVERLSEQFRSYERPRRVAVLDEEFSVDNGMLTPKMSVRRNEVVRRYSAVLEGLYGAAD
jgi:long-chain acyl-CoA synthetase